MFGLGLIEMASMFLWLPFIAGVPLGLPPGPEDAVMAQMAPEECLFYATWSPRGAADPKSNNETEKLLAEPEVQRFAMAVQREIQRAIDRVAQQNANEATRILATLTPKLITWTFTETAAFAVNEFAMTETGPMIKASAVARLGETGKDIPGLLKQLQKLIPQEGVKAVKVKGIDATRIQIDPRAPEIVWGISKGYLVVGVGPGSLEALLDRMNGKVPGWLTALKASSKIERRSSISFINVAAIAELGGKYGGEMAAQYIDALGVGNIKTIESVTGLDDTGFISRTLMRIDGAPSGVFAFADAAPLSKEELKVLPRDTFVALAARIDFATLLPTAFGVVEKIDPNAVVQMRGALRQIEDEFRIQVQEDVLEALGDTVIVYSSPSTGGFLAGWTASIEVKDQKRLQSLAGIFAANLAAGPPGRAPQIKRLKSDGEEIQFLVFAEPVPFSPAWCITENELIIGVFPQTVIGHLSNRKAKNSLVDHPAVKELWGADAKQGPLSLAYADTQTLFSLGYPMLQFGAAMAFGEARRNGFDLDVSILPASSALTPHLLPTVGSTRRVSEGIEFVQHQTFPGGSIGASAPISVALLLPAVQAAREAARRTQSMNNMKRILLACHNYHDVFNGLPPAYNVDEEKKPLLSWRVHILPFVEQQQLYDQFHLDEPWDSEHNKKLIAQMPPVYRSPRSAADPTMTTYLTPRSETSAFAPDPNLKAGDRRGNNFAKILDGTSNTIAVVEVDDDHAVIWTKPDDYEYTDEDPLQALRNTWRNVFLAGMCDGSVQAISSTINPDVLKALFTRNGGEAVQY